MWWHIIILIDDQTHRLNLNITLWNPVGTAMNLQCHRIEILWCWGSKRWIFVTASKQMPAVNNQRSLQCHCDRKLIAFISCLCGLWLRLFDANPCLESSCKPTSRSIEKQRQKTAADLHDSQYHHSRCVQDTVEARKCAVLSFKYLSKINSCCCLLFRLLLWKALWRNRVCWNEWGEP